MYRNRNTRIVPVVIILIVLVALIAGLVTVGRYLFAGNGQHTSQQDQQKTASAELLKTDASRSVRMTVRGPIVADQKFQSYQIQVSPANNTYTVYQGYLDSVQSSQSYQNNTAGYTQFVYALNEAALTHPGKYSENEASDVRGICATGRVYDFAIMNGSDIVDHYWTSTCKGSPGTLGANLSQVTNLFVKQIPGLNDTFGTNSLVF